VSLGRPVPAAPSASLKSRKMNHDASASPSTKQAPTAEPPQGRTIDPRALAATLAAVRADSQRTPETYLRDTVVPHGGE
jgi:hypothetical protein